MGKKKLLNKKNEKHEKTRKRAWIIITVIFLFAILLFPNVSQIKDGGSVEYHAVLYQVVKWHRYEGNQNFDKNRPIYYDGTEIKILGITVYNNAENMVYMYCE